MKTSTHPKTTKALTTIVSRYQGVITAAAAGGTRVWIMSPGTDRPAFLVRGDGRGNADLAICTDDGDRPIVFCHWADDDHYFPENWPAPIPVPNYN